MFNASSYVTDNTLQINSAKEQLFLILEYIALWPNCFGNEPGAKALFETLLELEKEMELIVFKELIADLNDPESELENQEVKYDWIS